MPTEGLPKLPSRPPIARAALALSMLLLCLALAGGKALAQSQGNDTLRPAAVVNDELISVLDLVMRTRLAI
ncbi:MAG TPA: hypothetical protein VKN76_06605, partial [Kiloniellaceae bacterium]|nr:hypothetical protein [Kiloniellaceae bacterium]